VSLRRAAALLACLLAVGALPPTAAASAPRSAPDGPTTAGSTPSDATSSYLEGIDVSHWQNSIDWAKVAAAGKAFAIIKASEATDYVDPLYVTNRAAAQANGIWTGAYHFARPDATAGDAAREADHFADTVVLGRGDLIPALDLEQSGGLGVAALQAWVTTWLGEVTSRTGVRPMIYTSPAFWKKYMGDSRALADAGYKVLWIAHWGVTAPTVPASNWGGRGWTFWQYSNCGTVPGISGCVDLDRYNGTDLTKQAFSGFSLSASGGGSVKQGSTGAATVGISRTNFDAEVALDVSGLPAGASASFDASPTTGTSSALTVATDAATTPTGTYALTISGTGDGLTRTTRLTLTVADGLPPTVTAPTMWLEPNAIVGATTIPVYVAWSASDPSGIASSALQRNLNGGGWTTVPLPTATSTRVWQWLPIGVKVGQHARATDRLANTSAWTAGPAATTLLSEQYAGSIRYSGTWHTLFTPYSHGSSQKYATSRGASATYTFTGSSVGWVATRGPNRGTATVYVDGAYAGTINLGSSIYQWRRVVFARNWGTVGSHTLRIVVNGTAGRPVVDVDAFIRLATG